MRKIRCRFIQIILGAALVAGLGMGRGWAADAPAAADPGNQGLPAPTNDLCANAIDIGNGHFDGWTINASNDGGAPCGPAGLNDVWYRYTAPTTGSVIFSTCNSGPDTVLSLSSGCPGAPFNILYGCSTTSACGNEGRIVRNVTQGEVIYIRVATTNAGFNLFDLDVNLNNETCAVAPPIGLGITRGSTIGATADGTSACGLSGASPDVYYRFTATSTRRVEFNTCSTNVANDWDTVLSVHSGCPATVANSIACNDDACGSYSRIILDVTQGTTYFIRVAGYNGAQGEFALEVANVSKPNNDDCSASVPNLTNYGTFFYGQTLGATNDGTTTCGNSNTSPDVWYRFTAPESRTVKMTLCGSDLDWNSVLSLHSACPLGASNYTIACNDDLSCGKLSTLTVNTIQGTNYYLRVAGNNGAVGEFALSIFPNDDCANATPITTYGSYYSTTVGATNDGASSCAVDQGTRDVWFRFTAPETRPVILSTCNSDGGGQLMSVHSACPGTIANEILCDSRDGCGNGLSKLTLNAVQGTTYYIRLFDLYIANYVADTVQLDVEPVPDNDSCASAQAIGYGSFQGNSVAATKDGTISCFNNNNRGGDLWFLFTAPETRAVKIKQVTTGFYGLLSVHSGCPGTINNEIACLADYQPEITIGVQQGQQYLICASGQYAQGGPFTLSVTAVELDNDNCAAALPIGFTGISGTNLGATPDGTGCYAGYGDVWYAYTAPVSGTTTVDTCGSNFDTFLSVHTGCPGTLDNQVACNDDGVVCGVASKVQFEAVADTTYYIRVGGLGSTTGNFNLKVTPPPPSNETCVTATTVTAGSYPGLTAGASPSIESPGCGEAASPDVWYRYTSPGVGTVTFDTCAGASFDTVISAYSGCPGISANLLACNDDFCGLSSSVQLSVTPGTDYYIRVAGLVASGSGSFTLTVTENVYNGRIYGDLNNDSCVNLDDFLLLLDYWEVEYAGQVVGLNDFLALLDYWETCPGPG